MSAAFGADSAGGICRVRADPVGLAYWQQVQLLTCFQNNNQSAYAGLQN
jgi:hypothetical protein